MVEKSALNIDKIILHNYRTYLGTHELTISTDPNKPITIIHGQSGMGKTTILNAIIWALYGSERVQLDTQHMSEGIMNKYALEHLALNDTTETFVELWLVDDDDTLAYRIKRTIQAFKSSDIPEQRFNNINSSLISEGITFQPQSLTVHYRSETVPQPVKVDNVDDAQRMIENIFPKQLSSYILFDAELLYHFLTQKEEDLVKRGIEEISGLPLIDTVVSNLQKTSRKITQELKQQIAYRGLIERVESLEQKYDKCKLDHEEKKAHLQKLLHSEKEYRDYLTRHSADIINEKAKQLQEIENSERTLNKKIANTVEQFRNFLCETNYKLRLRNAITSTEQKFQQWEEADLIPPAISKLALDQMINSTPATCICGRTLNEGSPELLKLQQMHERIVDSTMIQEIMHGRARLSIVLENTTKSKLSEQHSTFSKELAFDRQKLSALVASRKSLMQELKSASLDDVRQVSTDLEQNRRDQISVTILIGEIEGNIKSIAKQHDDVQKQIDEAEKVEGKNTVIRQKTKLCKLSASRLQQLRTDLLDEFKTKTEQITSDYFLQIAPRKEDFATVRILPSFQLQALDKQGGSKRLSMGQSHCLGLSYIAAIREITKQNYFIIIDSPLHNISQQAKVELAERFPHYLKKTQLTLLVTDQEYTGIARDGITGPWSKSVREVLEANNCIWKEYKLTIEKTPTTHTKILEGA